MLSRHSYGYRAPDYPSPDTIAPKLLLDDSVLDDDHAFRLACSLVYSPVSGLEYSLSDFQESFHCLSSHLPLDAHIGDKSPPQTVVLSPLSVQTFFHSRSFSNSSSEPTSRSRSKSSSMQTRFALDPFCEPLYSFVPAGSHIQFPDLLDDDPFANLSTLDIVHSQTSLPNVSSNPTPTNSPPRRSWSSLRNSPSLSDLDHIPEIISTSPPSNSNSNRFLSPPGLARPAYTKPAFNPTISLPSLRALARGNAIPTRTIRRGRVGATLPLEPWNTVRSHSEDHTSSWLTDLDVPPSRYHDEDFSFDKTPEDSSVETDGEASLPSSNPSSSYSWDSLSTSDHSHVSSVTAYSIDSDRSRSDSVQIDFSHPSQQVDFDLDLSDEYLQSYSFSSLSDNDEDSINPSTSPEYLSSDESSFFPGTSAETIRPRLAPSLTTPSRSPNCLNANLQPDTRSLDASSPQVGPTPCNSMYSEDMSEAEIFDIGEFTGWDGDPNLEWMGEVVDSSDGNSRSGAQSGQKSDNDYFSAEGGGHSDGLSWTGRGGGSGSGGNEQDDDDDRKKRPSQLNITSSFPDSDSEEEDEEDDYGDDIDDIPSTSPPQPTSSGNQPDSDSDDVPLAQAIPSALKAQKFIRRDVKNEAAQRKRDKAVKKHIVHSAGVVPASQPDSVSSLTRQRTRTMPSRPSAPPIALDDLNKKLLGVQVTPPLASSVNSSRSRVSSGDLFTSSSRQEESVKRMRSFHHSRTRTGGGNDLLAEQASPHSTGMLRGRRPRDISVPLPAGKASRARSTTGGYRSGDEASHSSADHADFGHRAVKPPPLPPLPTYEAAISKPKPEPTWQQRVFIGDLQRFNVVEVGNSSSAQDVVDLLESQGELKGNGWMMFELAQDFGMERPIRSFELLSEVIASWNQEKTVNLFVLKRTQLAHLLTLSAMPTSSPICRGYIDYEIKRGKWVRRWMELREHSLWLSKRDSMKDQIFLCKMSNFDVYYVTRVQKSPKPFIFAVKSTDNLALFENTADYLHTFSCKEQEGLEWMTKILLARSYVLHQERRIISSKTAGLSKLAPRKSSRAAQPLVTVATSIGTVAVAPKATTGSHFAQRGRFET